MQCDKTAISWANFTAFLLFAFKNGNNADDIN